MKFFSENHSGDVDNHSGRLGFFIHFSPESLFTSRRNPYSHHSGTIIHMPRNPQGVKKLGVRLGNWLTAEQGQALWQAPDRDQLKGKRDRALLALLLACGLRRHELAALTFGHLQQREGHWAIVDLRGKAGHVRTIPVPDWVHCLLDDWTTAAGISTGSLFRRVSSAGKVWGE